ncbi:LytR/AlgR family response regulator transcription factor [Paenibacillus tarimensis]
MTNREIKVIVIDDEPHSRDELKHLLSAYGEIRIIAEADSGEKGLHMIMMHEPDVVFVDIEMPLMTGLEMVEAIQKLKTHPLVIFATAYPEYAAKAFRVHALDYLLKPFDEEQLKETMARISEALRHAAQPAPKHGTAIAKLAVEDEGRIVYLPPADIVYLYRDERETVICTKDRKYASKLPLKELEAKLKGYPFFRTHKSYLVRLDTIEQLIPWFNGAYQLKVVGRKDEIPVSRNYVKALREQLEL